MESFRALVKIEKIKKFIDINLENIYVDTKPENLETLYNLIKDGKIPVKTLVLLEEVCNKAVLPVNSMYALDIVNNIERYKFGTDIVDFALRRACETDIELDNIPFHFYKNDLNYYESFKKDGYPLDIFYNENFAAYEVYNFAIKCYENSRNPFDYVPNCMGEKGIDCNKISAISAAFDKEIDLKEYVKDYSFEQLNSITQVLEAEKEGYFINETEIIQKEYSAEKIEFLLEAVKENCYLNEFKNYSNEDCKLLLEMLSSLDIKELDIINSLLKLASQFDVEKAKALLYAMNKYSENIYHPEIMREDIEKAIVNLASFIEEYEPKKAMGLFLLAKSNIDIEKFKNIDTEKIFLKLDTTKYLKMEVDDEIFKLNFENAYYYILATYYNNKAFDKCIDAEKIKFLKPEECQEYFENSIKNNIFKLTDKKSIKINYKYYDGDESIELPNGYLIHINEQEEEPDIDLLSEIKTEDEIIESFYSENFKELEMLAASLMRPTLNYESSCIVDGVLQENAMHDIGITSVADIIFETENMLEDMMYDDNTGNYSLPYSIEEFLEYFDINLNECIPSYKLPTGEILALEKSSIEKEYGSFNCEKDNSEILRAFEYECKLFKCYDEGALYTIDVYDEEDNFVISYDCIFAEDVDKIIDKEIIPEYCIESEEEYR